MKRMLSVLLMLGFACCLLGAQDKKAEKKSDMKHDHAAMHDQGGMPPMAKPSPEMTKLIKMFSGSWTTAEKFEPGPMMPKGGSSKGNAVFKPGPGGMSLIEEYSSPHGAMGPFTGRAVIWWDAKAGAYKSTWCDSMSPECMVGTSKFEGDKLVSTPQEMDMGGQKMVSTGWYENITPDSFTMVLGGGPTAEQAKTFMTIVYTRQASKTAMPAAKKDTAKK